MHQESPKSQSPFTGTVDLIQGKELYQTAIDATQKLMIFERTRQEALIQTSVNDLELAAAENRVQILERALLNLQFFMANIKPGR